MTPFLFVQDEFSLRSWLEAALASNGRENSTERDLVRLYATSVIANRAANKRADNVALVPLVIRDARDEPLAKTHPMILALERQYRDNMRRSELTLCFYGRNLLWKRRNYNGTVFSLRWLNPRLWMPDEGFRQGLRGFTVYREGRSEEPVPVRYIERQDAIYMHGVDFDDDFDGVAPAEVALRHAQLEVELAETQVWFMRNRAVPFALVQPAESANKKPDKADKDALTSLLRRMYQGARNAGRTLVQSARWEWIQMQGKWNEMAFREQFDQAYEAVATAFDMPVALLRSNFANFAEAETLRRDWAQSWLLPRMEWYAEIFTEQLAQDVAMVRRFGSGLVVAPDTANVAIFKEDMAAKVNVINVKVAGGYMDLYQAALQSGEKNPPDALRGKYMWGGVPYPVEQVEQLWQSKIVVPESSLPAFATPPMLPDTSQSLPARPVSSSKAVSSDEPRPYTVMACFDDTTPIVRVQDTLRGLIPAEAAPVHLVDPKTFHLTLVSVADGLLADVQDALPLNPAAFSIVVDGMSVFQTDEGYAVHLTVRKAGVLLPVQAALYQTIAKSGAEISDHSVPERYQPHITLAYLPFAVEPFDITPFALMVNRLEVGDGAHNAVIVQYLKAKWLPDVVHKELVDWQRILARKGREYAFEARAVSDAHTTAFIALALDSDHSLDAIFDTARLVLREGLTPEEGWEQLEMRSAKDYERSIRALVRGLWNGSLSRFDFVDTMYIAIRRHFRQAWLEGAAEAGVQPDDLTEAEFKRLNDEINAEMTYVVGFADVIEDNNKANGGKLTPLLERASKWVNSFTRIKEMARVMANEDARYQWVIDTSKENCPDCLALNGRVYRASVWAKYNLHPKSRDLNCGPGGNCGCRFEPTDSPVTKGRPPKLIGPRRHTHEVETT